jgi:hypothetical protein
MAWRSRLENSARSCGRKAFYVEVGWKAVVRLAHWDKQVVPKAVCAQLIASKLKRIRRPASSPIDRGPST